MRTPTRSVATHRGDLAVNPVTGFLRGASSSRGGFLSEHRLAAGCAGGMALATAGSWLRFALARTPRIHSHSYAFLLASLVSGAGLILSGVCSLCLVPQAQRLSWRAPWAWCAAAQLCAFLAL